MRLCSMNQNRPMLWVLDFAVASRHAAHGNCAGAAEREYDLDLITSAPTVVYEVVQSDGSITQVDNRRVCQITSKKCVNPLLT